MWTNGTSTARALPIVNRIDLDSDEDRRKGYGEKMDGDKGVVDILEGSGGFPCVFRGESGGYRRFVP